MGGRIARRGRRTRCSYRRPDRRPRLLGVVKDHTERVTVPAANATHAVPQVDPVRAARAPDRAMMNGEDHSVALTQRDDLGSRLHAGPLLGDHELAAREVPRRLGQQDGKLQRKDMLAIQILMQAVVVVRRVLEQKRCRPGLPGRVAASQKIWMAVRIEITITFQTSMTDVRMFQV